MHIYVEIYGHRIPTYGLLITIGVILANLIAIICMKRKYKKDCIEDFLIVEAYTMAGAFLGAKCLYLLVSYRDIDWENIFNIKYFNTLMQGGFVFYGGLIGGLIFIFLPEKIHKIEAEKYIEHYIFLIPLIHAFGRIGCFEAGCCYGIPYTGYGAVYFPEGSMAPPDIALFPVQIIEAFFEFIIAAYIYRCSDKLGSKKGLYEYLWLYSLLRFVLEFFRYDVNRGKIGFLSTSQIISLVIAIIVFEKKRKINNYGR